MNPDQLLEPRYIIKNDYPGCPYEIGSILHVDHEGELYSKECGYSQTAVRIMQHEADRFTHLIGKLHWWEGRSTEDLTEWVKNASGEVFMCHKIHPKGGKVLIENLFVDQHYSYLEELLPATHEEYENYIKQQQTNKSE